MRNFGRGWQLRCVHLLLFSPGRRFTDAYYQRPSVTAPSWQVFCDRHWTRFERLFTKKEA